MDAKFWVVLPIKYSDALIELAEQEGRRPKEQAAHLIYEALEQRGLLSNVAHPHPDVELIKQLVQEEHDDTK